MEFFAKICCRFTEGGKRIIKLCRLVQKKSIFSQQVLYRTVDNLVSKSISLSCYFIPRQAPQQ